MVKNNNNIKKRSFKHLSQYERGMIYTLIQQHKSIQQIARIMGRAASIVLRELLATSEMEILNLASMSNYFLYLLKEYLSRRAS
ncbi:integrase catalytic region [Caldicellulosiruptor acetigenus I77R1B]|uniref:Integrase catalytic region n=1 Tax=Caldicellulosiruptor acetigenus (strain ATCC 700853 / DSM 12137 / I77R1B) TaxID=632335 RepID=E4S445_CALA7|nr:helix-turn-helix domain-containing protein [Caldicellulosiruptor acetigenus]ADQ41312.1 integrase catalytic region [Caldicellulosiruptor acetigenus I77R1B]